MWKKQILRAGVKLIICLTEMKNIWPTSSNVKFA